MKFFSTNSGCRKPLRMQCAVFFLVCDYFSHAWMFQMLYVVFFFILFVLWQWWEAVTKLLCIKWVRTVERYFFWGTFYIFETVDIVRLTLLFVRKQCSSFSIMCFHSNTLVSDQNDRLNQCTLTFLTFVFTDDLVIHII